MPIPESLILFFFPLNFSSIHTEELVQEDILLLDVIPHMVLHNDWDTGRVQAILAYGKKYPFQSAL